MANLYEWMDTHSYAIDDETDMAAHKISHEDMLESVEDCTYALRQELEEEMAGDFIAELLIDKGIAIDDEQYNRLCSRLRDAVRNVSKLTLQHVFSPDELRVFDAHGISEYEDLNDMYMNWFHDMTDENFYPVVNTVWQFPSKHSAEYLNLLRIPNVVFFDVPGHGTFIGLTGFGMDMTPVLHYSYAMYGDLPLEKNELMQAFIGKGRQYYEYLLGPQKTDEYVRWLRSSARMQSNQLRATMRQPRARMPQYPTGIPHIMMTRNAMKTPQPQPITGIVPKDVILNPEKSKRKAPRGHTRLRLRA